MQLDILGGKANFSNVKAGQRVNLLSPCVHFHSQMVMTQ